MGNFRFLLIGLIVLACDLLQTNSSTSTTIPDISLEVGYIFPESMDIIINNVISDNTTLKYSRVLEVDKSTGGDDLKEFEVTIYVRTYNGTNRVRLTDLKPDSDYEICAVVRDMYACEMARTYRHINSEQAAITGAVSALVVLFAVLCLLAVLHAIRYFRTRKFGSKERHLRRRDASHQTIATIS